METNQNVNEVLKERLGIARSKLLMSQEEAAEKIGFTRAKVKNAELGHCNVKAEDLAAFAKLYETTSDYLLGLSDDSQIFPRAVDSIRISEKAIENLRFITSYAGPLPVKEALNILLSSKHLYNICIALANIINADDRKSPSTKYYAMSKELYELISKSDWDAIPIHEQIKYQEYRAKDELSEVVKEVKKCHRLG